MGRREFYAWVAQVHHEVIASRETSPDSWDNVDKDPWWQEKRAERRRRFESAR